MAVSSIHLSHRGGGFVPNRHVAHTIHDTNELEAWVVKVIADVTTAGNLVLEMWDGTSVAYSLPIGLHQIDGQFRRAKATSTTAVLSPANTVVIHYID